MPSCPRWFDGEARTEWRWLIAELKYMGLLTRADRGIMIGYCIAVADVREAVETLRTEGRTLKTTNGNVIQNPAVVRKNRALALLRSYCAELGLSPTSRARISVPLPEKKRSAWEGLLA
jgi:P27 family predicted phage terminase small subunit